MEQNQTSPKDEPLSKPNFVIRARRKCIVCENPKNVEVTEKYINQEISLRGAGEELGCHFLTFDRHLARCVYPLLERDSAIAPDLRVKIDKIRILEDMVQKLYVRAQLLMDQDDSKGNEIKAVVSELNNAIMNLAKLKKEIGSDSGGATNADLELFRKAAEEILTKEDPEIWKKIRLKMLELATARFKLA